MCAFLKLLSVLGYLHMRLRVQRLRRDSQLHDTGKSWSRKRPTLELTRVRHYCLSQ